VVLPAHPHNDAEHACHFPAQDAIAMPNVEFFGDADIFQQMLLVP